MRKILFFLVLLMTSQTIFGQIKAVTDAGDIVILNNDGTWKYEKKGSDEFKIGTNTTNFTKSSQSTFLLKSSKIPYGIYIDPKAWGFTKGTNNKAAEYELTLKGKDAYAMIITEKIEIPLEDFGKIALDNAKEASPDIVVTQQEYRIVNGKKILFLQMKGTVKGIKASFVAYYYSSPDGSIQIVSYTSTSLLPDYKNNLEQLLNGFVTDVK